VKVAHLTESKVLMLALHTFALFLNWREEEYLIDLKLYRTPLVCSVIELAEQGCGSANPHIRRVSITRGQPDS